MIRFCVFLSCSYVNCVNISQMIGREYHLCGRQVVAWLSGSALASINVVTLHRARLVLGWVTVGRHLAGWQVAPTVLAL